jgi:cob(I)alamin adenosyltransferase
MVQLTQIYTRSGDKGKTSLGDGSRVPKFDQRIHAIGTVDELNALLGIVRLYLTEPHHQEMIARLQNDLFDVGADLCWPEAKKPSHSLRIRLQHTERLEKEIDQFNQELKPLQSFVLPGGSLASAYLHLARTIARRAERIVCEVHERTPINPLLLCFLNRLSDYLFVMARYLNNKGQGDLLWVPGKNLST